MAYSPSSPLLEKLLQNVCSHYSTLVVNITSYRTAAELNNAIENSRFDFVLQMDDSLKGIQDNTKLVGDTSITLR